MFSPLPCQHIELSLRHLSQKINQMLIGRIKQHEHSLSNRTDTMRRPRQPPQSLSFTLLAPSRDPPCSMPLSFVPTTTVVRHGDSQTSNKKLQLPLPCVVATRPQPIHSSQNCTSSPAVLRRRIAAEALNASDTYLISPPE